ncbi:MAG: WD40 repeat protein [Cognaticolwellia sp.]|jgi:WD40 repeat protein
MANPSRALSRMAPFLMAPSLMAPALVALATACSPAETVCLTEISRYEADEQMVYDLGWSPDSRHLLTGSVNLLRLYDLAPNGALSLLDTVYSPARFNSIQWSPDGAHALAPTGTELRMFGVSTTESSPW